MSHWAISIGATSRRQQSVLAQSIPGGTDHLAERVKPIAARGGPAAVCASGAAGTGKPAHSVFAQHFEVNLVGGPQLHLLKAEPVGIDISGRWTGLTRIVDHGSICWWTFGTCNNVYLLCRHRFRHLRIGHHSLVPNTEHNARRHRRVHIVDGIVERMQNGCALCFHNV